jgi:hypothetical protein
MKVLSGVLLAAALFAQSPVPDCSLVPGWKQHGAVRGFDNETLYEYMNGNSEGYLIYGFRSMRGVTCKSGENTFVIDISEMSDADGAYGIFTANQDPAAAVEPVGTAGQITPRRAVFVKDRFYVEITAEPEGDHTPALRAFAAALEKLTPGTTARPTGLAWFPSAEQTSCRLVPESLLGLRVLKRGYVAEYPFGKAFVVTEASPEAAAGVFDKVKARFRGVAASEFADGAFQVEDKYLGRVFIFRKGRYVAGWANVGDGREPLQMAGELAAKLP